jgi:hypothetical protein
MTTVDHEKEPAQGASLSPELDPAVEQHQPTSREQLDKDIVRARHVEKVLLIGKAGLRKLLLRGVATAPHRIVIFPQLEDDLLATTWPLQDRAIVRSKVRAVVCGKRDAYGAFDRLNRFPDATHAKEDHRHHATRSGRLGLPSTLAVQIPSVLGVWRHHRPDPGGSSRHFDIFISIVLARYELPDAPPHHSPPTARLEGRRQARMSRW